jgi:5-methylcytosine-specific restriction endonuclease McrBC regulatory subunit McrC
MADQFAEQNRGLLRILDARAETEYDGREVRLAVHSGRAVGAIPLLSPTTARPDYGLVIQPRFEWSGIGPMLADMGWRVSPAPLKLPLLRRSERRVPVWVLAYMILTRLEGLLKSLDRRFETANEFLTAPRGRVHWDEYATRSISHAKYLVVPCAFPELQENRQLKGAIRNAAERQLRAIETQTEHGAFVHRLIEFAQRILDQVRHVPVYVPSSKMMTNWLQRPMHRSSFVDGLQAIEWTIEERGLAGISDLEGIPWTMPMDKFFEAWVETVSRGVARRIGAQVRTGRLRETVQAINWNPPYLGSQKSLIPDIWLESEAGTLIIDAKYKRHWEELQQQPWARAEEQLREEHRNDLLQVLAYANLAGSSRIVVCLVYPCAPEVWRSLDSRGRLMHKADITVGSRSLRLCLTAIPMAVGAEQIASRLAEEFRTVLCA